MTAVKTVFSYLAMFAVIGFLVWILNPIIIQFRPYALAGEPLTLANYLWDGILLVIIVFSTFWLIRKLKEWQVVR